MSTREHDQPAADCLGADTLGQLVEGQLDASAVRRAERHIADCDVCRQLTQEARGLLASDEAAFLEPGARVGRYVIIEAVGAGAMGTVYAAYDPDLDRRVALKLLRSHRDDEQLRARLSREAKAMARLSHPHVVTVFDVGSVGPQLFVAMEFIGGGTLRQWLARRPRGWYEVLWVFLRAGRGLGCAHAAGLVHRDFKPDNVLVGEDGRVCVTDFGLARSQRDEGHSHEPRTCDDLLDATITRTGARVGTPAYMAPEQFRGEPAHPRADVFSFCVALHEALYGKRPFEGNNIRDLRSATALGHVRPPPADSAVPPALHRVLLTGLKASALERPEMDELLRALEAAAPRSEDGPTPWESAGALERSHATTMADALLPLLEGPPRAAPSRRLRLALGSAAALGLVVVWLAAGTQTGGERASLEPAVGPAVGPARGGVTEPMPAATQAGITDVAASLPESSVEPVPSKTRDNPRAPASRPAQPAPRKPLPADSPAAAPRLEPARSTATWLGGTATDDRE
jgi:serine/threonine protein kinase